MTELADSWSDVSEQRDGGFAGTTDGTLASFVDRVREESERLASIATTCQETAHALAEREASVQALELALGDRQRELDARHDELERRRQQQLNELAAEAEDANARIGEAARRTRSPNAKRAFKRWSWRWETDSASWMLVTTNLIGGGSSS